MRIESVELRRIHLPLVSPFRTSFGVQHDREVLLVRVRTANAEGWGECVAMSDPLYSSEYLGAAQEVLLASPDSADAGRGAADRGPGGAVAGGDQGPSDGQGGVGDGGAGRGDPRT